eukprot:CAMPEP_0119563550 /NCGR_PEP_ID=MMETSP1352-20130426/23822_1 /TAXON_ID=265584 /ORGANISM="Stauroneis constricta, Strain CCMP1120" /LENGTH=31 /DNA_ID= /DNA_START= /DNA_END= /DNA_ORIENTATION=
MTIFDARLMMPPLSILELKLAVVLSTAFSPA